MSFNILTTSKVLINNHYRLFVKASSSGLSFSLWCNKGFKFKKIDQQFGKYITCTTCTELIFALFFKMNMLCFYLKPQDRACPLWFMEGKIVAFYSRVGPRNPCPPHAPTLLQSGAVALNMLQLKPSSQEASVFKSQCLQVLNYSLDTIHWQLQV